MDFNLEFEMKDMGQLRDVEAVAWELALAFQASCKPEEPSSDFVYRLRDMLTEVMHQDRDNLKAYMRNRPKALSIRKMEIEAMVTGLQETMRPLLEEWSKIKTNDN